MTGIAIIRTVLACLAGLLTSLAGRLRVISANCSGPSAPSPAPSCTACYERQVTKLDSELGRYSATLPQLLQSQVAAHGNQEGQEHTYEPGRPRTAVRSGVCHAANYYKRTVPKSRSLAGYKNRDTSVFGQFDAISQARALRLLSRDSRIS